MRPRRTRLTLSSLTWAWWTATREPPARCLARTSIFVSPCESTIAVGIQRSGVEWIRSFIGGNGAVQYFSQAPLPAGPAVPVASITVKQTNKQTVPKTCMLRRSSAVLFFKIFNKSQGLSGSKQCQCQSTSLNLYLSSCVIHCSLVGSLADCLAR